MHTTGATGIPLKYNPSSIPSPTGYLSGGHPGGGIQSGSRLSGLAGIAGKMLEIEDVDISDGTPLLDIKPYVPAEP